MPITAGDIEYRLSGGASNTDPNASLGGAKSTAGVVDGALSNLFDVVSGAESSAGDTEYRCIYVHNAHETLTLQGAVVFVQTGVTSDDATVEIGLGASAIGGTEQAIADEDTAPAGVTFSAAAGTGGALTIGDIGPGEHKAVWIRRDIEAGASAINSDGITLRVQGDTAA